jgi:dihydrofolate reductase
MRRVRYAVAVSLDGYIAGPKGEADWIIINPEIDFRAVFEQFDTFLVGRRTFETMARAGRGETPGMKTFVFSRTLRQQDYPGVTVVAEKSEEIVAALRAEQGKDI